MVEEVSLTGLPTKRLAAKLTGVPKREISNLRRWGRQSCIVQHQHNIMAVFYLEWDQNKRRWLVNR